MSMVGGCTVQQLLRAKYKVYIRHVFTSGKFQAEIVRDNAVVGVFPDDCVASGSLLLTEKIWGVLYNGHIKYPMSQAYTYLHGKDIKEALENWDMKDFERTLLPVLEKREDLDVYVSTYHEVKDRNDSFQTYQLFDVLVRFYRYARQHNIKVAREGVSGLTISTPVEGLTNQSAECIDITDAQTFLSALKVIHPTAAEVRHGDKVYLVKQTELSPFSSACGDNHDSPTENHIRELIESDAPPPTVRDSVSGMGVVSADHRSKMVEIVGRILGQSGNPTTAEEHEVFHYSRVAIGEKKIGKNNLVGLGAVAGEGELGKCLDRVYQEVRKKMRGNLGDDDCFKLAASKLAQMNSAKVVQMVDGRLHLMERVVSGWSQAPCALNSA